MAIDLVVVGHFSKDTIITPEACRKAMGGVPSYSLFLKRWKMKLGIVSKCGPDFLMHYGGKIRSSGAVLVGSGRKTTEFVNQYSSNGQRTQEVGNIAEPIQMRDFPAHFYKAKAVHFGPIINEIELALIRNVHAVCPLVSLDPQGFCRRLDGKKVIPTPWKDASDVLPYVHLLKTTEKELKLIASSCHNEEEAITWTMRQGPKMLIITRGAAGASVFTEKEEISLPALPISAIDPTGAGDVFVLAFLAIYLESGDIQKATTYGGACAALSTEAYGPLLEFEDQKLQTLLTIARNSMNVRGIAGT
ncbi:MAG: PfkB family carbohydrate kinase [Candidatus Hodarchaeota archaeon]